MKYLGLVLFLVGCSATNIPFDPAQRANARSAEGYPTASYELIPQSARWGSARVFSRGISRVDGGESWVVHVTFEVENSGAEPIVFSTGNTSVEIATELGVSMIEAERSGSAADAAIAPGASQSFDLFYDLPGATAPKSVQRFTVIWSLDGPNRYTQRSEFHRIVPRSPGRSYCDNRPFDDFCDPFFYGFPLYVHTVDYDDRPAAPGNGPSGGGATGVGAPAPSALPRPRNRSD